MEGSGSSGRVDLPSGVRIGVGRETSATNEQGIVVQGMVFPVTLPKGSTTSVFVPYSEIHNTAQVKALIDERVRAIMAITG